MRHAALLLLLCAAPCRAQPAQNANIYNGTAHEPVKGEVVEREKAAGLKSPPQTQKRRDEDVEQLGAEVLKQSRQTLPAPATR